LAKRWWNLTHWVISSSLCLTFYDMLMPLKYICSVCSSLLSFILVYPSLTFGSSRGHENCLSSSMKLLHLHLQHLPLNNVFLYVPFLLIGNLFFFKWCMVLNLGTHAFSTTWDTPLALFSFTYFLGRVLRFYLEPASDCDPPLRRSLKAGITDMYHCSGLLIEMGVSLFVQAGLKLKSFQSPSPE
jgi:hypothetical protein